MDGTYSYPTPRSYLHQTLIAALVTVGAVIAIIAFDGGGARSKDALDVPAGPVAAASAPSLADMLFLESNLFLPSGREISPVAGFDQMRFLEANLVLPSAGAPARTVSIDSMRFLEEYLVLPASSGAIPPSEDDVTQPTDGVITY